MSSALQAPSTARVRAYFALPGTIFDAASLVSFAVDAAPSPWIDLGWAANFARTCGTRIEPLVTGAPGFTTAQVRAEVEAEVALEFESWGKLQLGLSAGAQQMNVLATVTNAAGAGSGGAAVTAVPVVVATSSTQLLDLGSMVSGFAVGDRLVVDVDYVGQSGAVGSGFPAGFVRPGMSIADHDYVRRVSFNVGQVGAINGTVLTLSAPLLAGAPVAGMKVSRIAAMCDREGATFFLEWAALFVAEGTQGDRVAWFYPRLQTKMGAAETRQVLGGEVATMRLAGRWRALPVVDPSDGEQVVCFRTYVAA